MTFKRILPIICLAICLFAMASVCASDANDTVMTSENSLEIDQTTKEVIAVEDDTEMTSSEEDVLTADELSFSQLNQTINRNDDGIVYLNSDYKYSDGDDSFKEGIVINRDVTIYGNGHIINGSKQSRIFQVTGGDVVFYNITFTNGQCDVFGGAISGKCEAINCIFNENFAKLSGGAIHKGYAVNCTFSGNTVDKFGGAMREGYAVNCTFSGNTAGNGGAMINSFAVNCTFIGNSAGTVGGAMEYGSAVNCTFINNTAYRGGCIYEGSAVNCTFINNTASQGGAMFAGYKWGCIAQNSNYQGTANLMLKWDVNNFTSEYGSATLPMLLRNQNKDLICFIN